MNPYSLYNSIEKGDPESSKTFCIASSLMRVSYIEIMDFGKPVKPREWFLLSIDVIDEAIARLKDGTIVDYMFDAISAVIATELKS